jgi:hypothetical protein
MRWSTVLSLPPQLVFPACPIISFYSLSMSKIAAANVPYFATVVGYSRNLLTSKAQVIPLNIEQVRVAISSKDF